MYVNRAPKFDEENVKNWKGGADGILVFVCSDDYSISVIACLHVPRFQTGLFASTVAQFISSSYQSLQQDPNAITQSLLAQISQQLAGSSNSTTNTTSPSINADSFHPPASAVFVNSVWILSLVLSLTCALMAAFFQQWTRRYLQITRRDYSPHVRAHIIEYFARGADKFHISVLFEALAVLLVISVLLFFSGLVVFAFRGNDIVAIVSLAIVTFCTLSYIALSLASLIFHDCPYQTPLSTLFWFCAQMVPLFVFSVVYHGAKWFGDRLGVANTGVVKAFRDLYINKKKSFSEGMITTLEGSAKRFSLDIYRSALCRTLNLLDEDHELEEFVAGIPGFSESEALRTFNPLSPNDAGRVVLAALPGPVTFHDQLPWSIVQLSHRAITSNLPGFIRWRRTQACLKALYYIPGAIRDVLAPYAAGTHYCLKILPLLNSLESLNLIEELWHTTNEDIALSLRCVAAVISTFILTPHIRVLDTALPPGVRFIRREELGSNFLSRRLHMDENLQDDSAHRNDSARLQNIVLFLKDIRVAVSSMDDVLSMLPDTEVGDVRAERRILRESRHEKEYRWGKFKSHGNRTSQAFAPAVQHDLLELTLEIVTRDSVTGATQMARDAFHEAFSEFVTFVNGPLAEKRIIGTAEERIIGTTEGRIMGTAEMVVDALSPVAEKLGLLDLTAQPRPNRLPLAYLGAAFSTLHGIGLEPEPELRTGTDEVTLGQLPLSFSGAVASSEIVGVTVTADNTSA